MIVDSRLNTLMKKIFQLAASGQSRHDGSIYLLVVGALIVPMLQYAMVVVQGLLTDSIGYWQLSDETLSEAGSARYIKDFYLAILAVVWIPLAMRIGLSPSLRQLLRVFLIWFIAVLAFGVLPFLFSDTPLFFLIAGIRWMLLLYASFGIFFLLATLQIRNPATRLNFPLAPLWAILLLNIVVAFAQFLLSDVLAFGVYRSTGVFGNAAVLGTVAVALGILKLCLRSKSKVGDLVFLSGCWLLSALSGARFALIVITVLIITRISSWIYPRFHPRSRPVLVAIGFSMALLGTSLFGYQALVEFAGRGDLIDVQREQGGRIFNFFWGIDQVISANPLLTLFGAGLGVGTNSAFIMGDTYGVGISAVQFNWQVDNTFLTMLFQLGFIGSGIFWIGAATIVLLIARLTDKRRRFLVAVLLATALLGFLTSNFFELTYLMFGYSIGFGLLVTARRSPPKISAIREGRATKLDWCKYCPAQSATMKPVRPLALKER